MGATVAAVGAAVIGELVNGTATGVLARGEEEGDLKLHDNQRSSSQGKIKSF
jgi:hypothetical protein